MWQEDLQNSIRDFLRLRQLAQDPDLREQTVQEHLSRAVSEFCDTVVTSGGAASVAVEEQKHTIQVDLAGYHWERTVSIEAGPDAATVYITWTSRGTQTHCDEWKVELKELDLTAEKVSSRLSQLLTLDLRAGRR